MFAAGKNCICRKCASLHLPDDRILLSYLLTQKAGSDSEATRPRPRLGSNRSHWVDPGRGRSRGVGVDKFSFVTQSSVFNFPATSNRHAPAIEREAAQWPRRSILTPYLESVTSITLGSYALLACICFPELIVTNQQTLQMCPRDQRR